MANKINDSTYQFLLRKASDSFVAMYTPEGSNPNIVSMKCALLTVKSILNELEQFEKDNKLVGTKSKAGNALDYRIWHMTNVFEHLKNRLEVFALNPPRKKK